MKKQLFIPLLLLVLMSMTGIKAYAHDFEVVNADGKTIYYVINDDGTSVSVSFRGSNYSSYSNRYVGDIVIPESVTYNETTYSVTSIGIRAFYNCKKVTSVTIPNSVTSIGNYAFQDCSITSVTIPNSVTSIGNYALSWCSITSITIPNSVTSIGDYCFYYCSFLTSVIIGNSVTSIGFAPFYMCSELTSIDVSSENTKYDSRDDCNAIIETSANILIVGCKSTIIPNNVTNIGGFAFSGSGLTSITIPNSVKSIGSFAFKECQILTSITIPNSVTFIGNGAFKDCNVLTSITIPNKVTSIDSETFSGCSKLTSITIPNSVTNIGYSAFSGCSELTSITIPNSVTSIGYSAFSGCAKLTSITIPNSVTGIGYETFQNCYELTSIAIPNSINSIGRDAFTNCYRLNSITIPSSVTEISSSAFSGCGLEEVKALAKTPPTATIDCFSNYDIPLFVLEESVAAYQSTSPWSGFSSIKTLLGQCARPTISIKDGKLHYDCETDGVEYHTKVVTPKIEMQKGNDVHVPTTYTIEVYATKDDYADSEVATTNLELSMGNKSDLKGDVNQDGVVSITDAVSVVNIILSNGAE